MIADKLVEKIVETSGKPRSTIYKSVVILVGASLILIIIPLLLLLASHGIEEYILSHRFRILQIRFGQEYEEYREKTPFLTPRF